MKSNKALKNNEGVTLMKAPHQVEHCIDSLYSCCNCISYSVCMVFCAFLLGSSVMKTSSSPSSLQRSPPGGLNMTGATSHTYARRLIIIIGKASLTLASK